MVSNPDTLQPITTAWSKRSRTATRRFRGKTIEIEVTNPSHVCRGVKSIALNGDALPENLVLADRMMEHNRVEIVMG
jgi:cellobiose phosphorylase